MGTTLRLLGGVVGALVVLLASQAAWAAAEVYRADGNAVAWSTPPAKGRPVLFVHGHNPDNANDSDLNYTKNWILPVEGTQPSQTLPSFNLAL